jgi:uncharacterized membrane protein YcaP (DUF421 family)
MTWINIVFGKGEDLTIFQMCMRALVIYIIAIVYVRLSGKRAFGRISTFDNIIVITLGAMLSRAIVGISPFVHVLASTLVLVMFHRFISWITQKNHTLGKLVKGEPDSLYKEGELNEKNLDRNFISRNDLMEGIRLKANQNKFDKVDEVFIERNGEFSVVKKDDDQ